MVNRVSNCNDYHEGDQPRGPKQLAVDFTPMRGSPSDIIEEDSPVQNHVQDCEHDKYHALAIVRGHTSVATRRHGIHLEEMVGETCQRESKPSNCSRNGNECA